MTVAQSNVVLDLGLALFSTWLLYFTHWRTLGRARPADAGEAVAWRMIEVIWALCGLIFMGSFVVAVLDATVWISPEGQRPAPAASPNLLDVLSGVAIVAFIVIPAVRALWRRLRRVGDRQ